MSFSYAIDPDLRLCYVRLEGLVEGNDLVKAITAVYEDARMRPDYDVLWNAAWITQLVLDRDDFEAVRETVLRYRAAAGGKGAVVAPRDLVYDAARFLKATSKTPNREVRVFKSTPQAMMWLGVDHLPEIQVGGSGKVA